CDLGWDTLPEFRSQLAYYQGKLLKLYRVDKDKEERILRGLYGRGKSRLSATDRVKVAHISKYLPQRMNRRTEVAMRTLMDSVYSALQAGADFGELANRYSDDEASRQNGGLLPWKPLGLYVQEWIGRLQGLGKDEPSVPFYSPAGIHIVKWVDRQPDATFEEQRGQLEDYLERMGRMPLREVPAEQKEWLAYRMQELHDGLLVLDIDRKYRSSGEHYRESDLERFFKQHQADYAWDLPHYRGAVIHCKDKKTANAIKKYLKQRSVSEWEEALRQLTENAATPQAKIEAGLFQIGKNPYIDKLVFKCGNFQTDPELPYTFVMGKKLKKGPESYEDVKEKVLADYVSVYGDAWMKTLRQKYKVEIHPEVLQMARFRTLH
ncbi:MAG: peptidyl-prolyl cis-trans isomerase, partial [Bacteroidales bacterium]|nr:peptidyl-prolyl cis-trans isomerase [Bacteroidales bacterium]